MCVEIFFVSACRHTVRMRVCLMSPPFQVGSLIGHDIRCAATAVGVNTRMPCVVAPTESLSSKQPAFNMQPGFVGTPVSALCSPVV